MLRDRDASEAEWRLCALEIEDEVPLSPREPQSASLATPRVAIFLSACVTHEVLQSVCRHGFIDPLVMRHSALPGAVGALERSKDNAIWGRTSLCYGFVYGGGPVHRPPSI